VPFDRDKLVRSLQISLRKRPVDPERVREDGLGDRARTRKRRRGRKCPSEAIGRDRDGKHLRGLDDVAYVRFASVYRQFPRGQGL